MQQSTHRARVCKVLPNTAGEQDKHARNTRAEILPILRTLVDGVLALSKVN
jgi:hypothetical protein